MADPDLRKRLATAAFIALDEETLDSIYARLINMEGGGKIPLTLKYDFTMTEMGEVGVDIVAKCNLTLQSHRLTLRTDGNQLGLFADRKAIPEVPEVPEDKAVETKPKAVKKPKAATKKKAARKKAAKKTAKPKEETAAAPVEEPASADPAAEASLREGLVRSEGVSVEDRLAKISENNIQLYRDGVIDRTQAKMAGVDVDTIDGVNSGVSSELTPDELEALAELSA
jgi:hypothetical protein